MLGCVYEFSFSVALCWTLLPQSQRKDADDGHLGAMFLQQMRNVGATCASFTHSFLIMVVHVWVVKPCPGQSSFCPLTFCLLTSHRCCCHQTWHWRKSLGQLEGCFCLGNAHHIITALAKSNSMNDQEDPMGVQIKLCLSQGWLP